MEFRDERKMVVSSNNLIEAKYNFSLWQKRIFVYMVSQITTIHDEFKLQKFYIKDLMNFFNVKSKEDYKIIRHVPEELYRASMKTPYRTKEGFKRWKEVRIISQYTRPEDKEADNAYIELKFNDDLKPHLIQLKELFAQYDIRNIIGLRSVYSFRIYEILKSRNHLRGEREITVDELKEILDVESKYKLYADFKRKVLQQAQRDLEEYCDIAFDFREIKEGKKVHKLEFSIRKNIPRSLRQQTIEIGQGRVVAEPKPASAEQPTVVSMLETEDFKRLFPKVQPHGISQKTFADWLAKFPLEHIEDCVEDFLKKIASGKISETDRTKQGGYLRTLIEKADFTARRELEMKKAEARKKEEEQKRQQAMSQQSDEVQKRAAIEREKQITRDILDAYEGLLEEITEQLNAVRGSDYLPEDFETNPLFRVLVIGRVKGRFPDAFSF